MFYVFTEPKAQGGGIAFLRVIIEDFRWRCDDFNTRDLPGIDYEFLARRAAVEWQKQDLVFIYRGYWRQRQRFLPGLRNIIESADGKADSEKKIGADAASQNIIL